MKRIIILTNGNTPYWDACRSGLDDAERELKLAEAGLDAVFEVNDGTPQGQIDKLKQYANQSDIVAIGISPVNDKNVAIADEMRNLQKKGIKVVAIDSDLDRTTARDARFAFIGTDNLNGGKVLGHATAVLRPEGGPFVFYVGTPDAMTTKLRTQGFGEGAGSPFKLEDTMSDEGDQGRARENVRNGIRNHPDAKTMVGIWSLHVPAIVAISKEQKLRDDPAIKVTIVGFDAEPQALVDMKEGNVDALVVQDPYAMAYQGVKLMKALVKDEKAIVAEMYPNLGQTDGDIFDTGLKVVIPNDDSPLKDAKFEGKVKVWTLPEFQKWLDQYNLKGS